MADQLIVTSIDLVAAGPLELRSDNNRGHSLAPLSQSLTLSQMIYLAPAKNTFYVLLSRLVTVELVQYSDSLTLHDIHLQIICLHLT